MSRLGTRLKEHKDACERCLTDKSAVAEHAWNQHHPVTWDGTKIIDQADELRLKETFHIHRCLIMTSIGMWEKNFQAH